MSDETTPSVLTLEQQARVEACRAAAALLAGRSPITRGSVDPFGVLEVARWIVDGDGPSLEGAERLLEAVRASTPDVLDYCARCGHLAPAHDAEDGLGCTRLDGGPDDADRCGCPTWLTRAEVLDDEPEPCRPGCIRSAPHTGRCEGTRPAACCDDTPGHDGPCTNPFRTSADDRRRLLVRDDPRA